MSSGGMSAYIVGSGVIGVVGAILVPHKCHV
jgi:hypothetical protein